MLPLTVTAALGMAAAHNAIPAQPVNASMPGAQMGSALTNGQIPASGMVEVSGSKVFFKAEGKGTPMLLIHGYPLNGELFKNNRTALAAAGYQVITVDLPGFGKSMVNSSDASIEFYARSILSVMDALGLKKAVVGGMSMPVRLAPYGIDTTSRSKPSVPT